MTTRDLIEWLGRRPLPLVGICLLVPTLAWLCGRLHARGAGGNAPWRFCYAILVYLACVPGMFAAVLTGYALLFTGENLLDADLLVYFLPVVSMVATLVFVRKSVDFDAVPGFDRLSGLMAMIGCSFALALAIQKMRLWVVFGGSIGMLFVLAAAIFGTLKWGVYMLFRSKDEPKRKPPAFPQE